MDLVAPSDRLCLPLRWKIVSASLMQRWILKKKLWGETYRELKYLTRPEGMVYGYDPYNQRMANYDLLKAEVQRCLKLLRRDHLDFLNLGFLKSALEHDPEYLHKMANNVQSLKQEGLIRFACADTFSGESTYLKQIETGCFDAIFINLHRTDKKQLKFH